MALHFIHVGKTGGTAIKRTLRQAGLPETPFGPVEVHQGHRFRLRDIGPEDHAMFSVRDPIALFLSAFYSRLRKGQPRYYFEWTKAEAEAFATFPTPQSLASALASGDPALRSSAERAMRGIRHMNALRRGLGSAANVRRRQAQIVYIARQETLDSDWPRIRSLLELPDGAVLPQDPRASHRRDPSLETNLDEGARAALRDWYADEYRLVELCERIRAENGWAGEELNSEVWSK
jgi:hypothetical protein